MLHTVAGVDAVADAFLSLASVNIDCAQLQAQSKHSV
jgi:hypothetical protein